MFAQEIYKMNMVPESKEILKKKKEKSGTCQSNTGANLKKIPVAKTGAV